MLDPGKLSKIVRRGCFVEYQGNISVYAGDSRARGLGEGALLGTAGAERRPWSLSGSIPFPGVQLLERVIVLPDEPEGAVEVDLPLPSLQRALGLEPLEVRQVA